MSELERAGKGRAEAKAAAPKPGGKPRRVTPRPSRDELDEVEAKLDEANRSQSSALSAIDREIAKLQSERDRLTKGFEPKRRELERRRDDADGRYQAALAKWRKTS